MRKEINKAKQEIIDGEGYSKRTLFLHTLHSQYFFVSVIQLWASAIVAWLSMKNTPTCYSTKKVSFSLKPY